jgi:hypothetical protein
VAVNDVVVKLQTLYNLPSSQTVTYDGENVRSEIAATIIKIGNTSQKLDN